MVIRTYKFNNGNTRTQTIQWEDSVFNTKKRVWARGTLIEEILIPVQLEAYILKWKRRNKQ